MRLEQVRADQGAEREGKGREARPALPVGTAQQQDRGEHADHRVEADRPGAANGQRLAGQVVRQREPEHGADAERDQRRLQPELRAEGLAAGRQQEARSPRAPRRGRKRTAGGRRSPARQAGRTAAAPGPRTPRRAARAARTRASARRSRRSGRSSGSSDARQASEMAASETTAPVNIDEPSSPPTAMPVTVAKTVSATQSSTSQAAEWSNHGARASRSPLPDGWLRSSSIKPFSLSRDPGTSSRETRKIGSMVT